MAQQSRFNRTFELIAGGVTVIPPMRIEFSADKSVIGGLNHLTVRVYNLNETHRLALVKDVEQSKRIPLSLSVGYQDTLHLVFKGTVHRGQNYREGPDFITELDSLDGGFDFLNSFTAATVKGRKKAVDKIVSDLPNTAKGKVRELDELLRPRVLVGQTMKLLDQIVNEGESWFIDDEKLFIMHNDEVVSSHIPVVKAQSGLLNTPTREYSKVTFETLMNPSLKIGGLCKLVSQSAPHLNGTYKIYSMGYTGDTFGFDWKQAFTAMLAEGYTAI